jgi:hypothetical protein
MLSMWGNAVQRRRQVMLRSRRRHLRGQVVSVVNVAVGRGSGVRLLPAMSLRNVFTLVGQLV